MITGILFILVWCTMCYTAIQGCFCVYKVVICHSVFSNNKIVALVSVQYIMFICMSLLG